MQRCSRGQWDESSAGGGSQTLGVVTRGTVTRPSQYVPLAQGRAVTMGKRCLRKGGRRRMV